jgi:hypothetical protein
MTENQIVHAQDIGVVGSPSTNTELTIDLLQEAAEERVVGALVGFGATQNGNPITSVGQIVSVELRNRWHEDSVFRNLIKRTGEIPPITNRQDTRTAALVVGATFARNQDGFDSDVLGMVPPTGTRIFRMSQSMLDSLLSVYRDELFYLGRAYANDVYYPMWFKHFGSGRGGAGEAYHMGVFGKTGSGKSGLAKMMLLGYARHREMGILIIDPQGEFSLEFQGTRVGQQGLAMDNVLRGLGRPFRRYSISEIQLDQWDLFEELLVSLRFTEQLGIPAASIDNSRRAAEIIRNELEKDLALDSLGNIDCLRQALNAITQQNNAEYIYSTRSRAQQLQQRISQFTNLMGQGELNNLFQQYWMPLTGLFASGQGRRHLYGIIDDLMQTPQRGQARPIIVIDISQRGNQRFWSEELQRKILLRLLNTLISCSSGALADTTAANILVVLDEAHRHAPSGQLDSGSQASLLRTQLRAAVRETRKYGIGWCFISQTLGGLDNELISQLRILLFGFGLALGSEFDKLKDFVGGDRRSMELYQSFRDPQSFPRRDLQEFPFMAVGPVSPLSFSGRPLFFTAFTDPNEFLNANGIAVQSRLGI